MPRPGVDVTLLDIPGSVSLPTDTGTAFVAGLSDRGPVLPTLIQSLSDFVTVFGDRQTYSVLYDWMDLFFREGGNQCYVSRVVGPAATVGTHNLLDAGAAISLVASAIGPGAWSANYKVAVVAGSVAGTFVIQVTDANNVVLEDSGNLVDQNSAIVWARSSKYIRLALGPSALIPAVAAATALSAGNDDRLNITDAQWQTALDVMTSDLGPGQVCEPGRTTTTAYNQLIGHANTHNRVAILDLPDSPTIATLESGIGALDARFAAAFAPWIVIPGLVQSTTRTVPPSALIAGLIGKNDNALGTNQPSAGNAGVSSYAIGVSQPAWSDTDRAALNIAGVNVIRNWPSGVRVYGWRSLANPTTDQNWIDFGNARLFMDISAELAQVGENFTFEDIDGQNGQTINAFHDALAGTLMAHWNNRELFGDTPDLAFDVDTGASVNTLATIANLELHAICYVKMAPFAEYVAIQVVKRSITE